MSETGGATREAAVIGFPVSHSRSPAIFSFLAEKSGMKNFRYSAIEVRQPELGAFIQGLRAKPEYVGLNVTIPHKVSIRSLLDQVTLEAQAVGAVNVVHLKAGRLEGHNTDVIGIVKTLEEQGCRIRGEDAWVWGAGGAARAVAFALGQMGARCVYILNRDLIRAEAIVHDVGAMFTETSFMAVKSVEQALAHIQPLSLLINSTPLGMKGAEAIGDHFSALSQLPLKRGALAFDLIYNPECTPFLSLADAQGIRCVGGLDMLIYQALATWELWFGEFKADTERQELKRALALHLRERPVFLTGFMGVGKSVVASALAAKLGWKFVDTDQLIVEQAGMSVPQIFEKKGEVFFRELECAAVSKAAEMTKTIVALGGGALINPESFRKVEDAGQLVCLVAKPDSLQTRLRNTASSRPLLAGLAPQEQLAKINAMLTERQPVYDRASFKVETDGRDPNDVARQILKLVFRERA
jgi:shikimate dehydrogenase